MTYGIYKRAMMAKKAEEDRREYTVVQPRAVKDSGEYSDRDIPLLAYPNNGGAPTVLPPPKYINNQQGWANADPVTRYAYLYEPLMKYFVPAKARIRTNYYNVQNGAPADDTNDTAFMNDMEMMDLNHGKKSPAYRDAGIDIQQFMRKKNPNATYRDLYNAFDKFPRMQRAMDTAATAIRDYYGVKNPYDHEL